MNCVPVKYRVLLFTNKPPPCPPGAALCTKEPPRSVAAYSEYAPPPKLTKVAEYEFVGKGTTRNDFSTLECGKHYKPGDTLIVVGNTIYVNRNDEYLENSTGKILVLPIQNERIGNLVFFRAEKGEKYKVEVWRME